MGRSAPASFNNEFGRPSLCGYFRTFEHQNRGYHKPIMLAGGIGAISAGQSHKAPLPVGALYLQLGGPGLLIGMGGGAASSMGAGTNVEDLDFDSVQRWQCRDRAPRAGSHRPLLAAWRAQPHPLDP
jgi:phosphoribosylformylglycinamidine synthase